MIFDDIAIAFPQEYLRVVLLVSLLSVWALVALFYQLNRYSQREHMCFWTRAWVFYALWLTLSLRAGSTDPVSPFFMVQQCCFCTSALLLLWGSLRFLGMRIPRRLIFGSGLFLAVWAFMSPQLMSGAVGTLGIHLPVFILLGMATPFVGVSLVRLQKEREFVGVGMLSLGILLWVVYVGSYPFPAEFGSLYNTGFSVAAVLQLSIAIGMVFLLFHEVRRDADEVRAEIETVRMEKEVLKSKVLATEEHEKAIVDLNQAQRAVIEKEHRQTLGQIAGDVAHDINNALCPITAYSEMLLSTLPDLPDVPRERLQRIHQAAQNVAQIVAQMREQYRAESSSSSLNANAQKQEAPAGLSASRKPSRPLRILCIDDEPESRQVLHDVLALENHQVTVAGGGKEGLELFRKKLFEGEAFEVVITDLGMPDMDGRNLARGIKAESPQTPVIMLTGWGATMEAEGKTASEVDAIIGKPARAQDLSNALFEVAERHAV